MKKFTIEDSRVQELKSKTRDLEQITLGSGGESWEENTASFKESILQGDISKFLQWPVTRKTMFVGECEKVVNEYNRLKESRRYVKAMEENNIGEPEGLSFDANTSGNLVHNLYSLYFYETYFDVDVSRDVDVIFEFGGGYGGLCRGVFQLGFSKEYILYDIPPVVYIQDFYTKTIGLDSVNCIDSYPSLVRELSLHKEKQNKMFIATWSLSEAPLSVRNSIIQLLQDFKYILIVFSGTHDGVDNQEYFNSLKINGISFHIEDHPYCPHGKFFIGKKC